MLVLIDNYDSFTYNLVQKFGEVSPGLDVRVFRNDKVTVDQVEDLRPDHLVISPGPLHAPGGRRFSNDLIRRFGPQDPDCWACASATSASASRPGAVVERADRLMHGKTDQIHHDGRTLYVGLPNPFTATRYHSLIIRRGTLPPEYEVTQLDRPRRDHGRPPQARGRWRVSSTTRRAS